MMTIDHLLDRPWQFIENKADRFELFIAVKFWGSVERCQNGFYLQALEI
jgi:hypothetical protein